MKHILQLKRSLKLWVVIALLLPQWSCDDTIVSSIPEASVYFTCDMAQSPYYLLKTASNNFFEVHPAGGGFMIKSVIGEFTGSNFSFHFGYSGLIIGNSFFNGFCAYDLCCPHEHDRSIMVNVEKDTGKAVCPSCGTVYDLNNGGIPVEGKSKEALKRYDTYLNGQTLIVRH